MIHAVATITIVIPLLDEVALLVCHSVSQATCSCPDRETYRLRFMSRLAKMKRQRKEESLLSLQTYCTF